MKTIALSLVGLLLAGLPLRGETRTWTDATGKFTVRAELVGVAAGMATLKREDGQVIRVAVAKLSPADQAILQGAPAAGAAPVAGAAAMAAAPAAAGDGGDWPGFRGPNRDDVSAETGLLKQWPEGGPKRLWVNEDVGLGYAGCSVVGGKLYTMGVFGDDEKVVCLDAATGKGVWDTKIGALYKNNWGDGPRGTPTLAGGRLYALGGNGDLACIDAVTGKKIWDKSLTRDLGGGVPSWGYAESPLVDGELVIVTPGGSEGTLAALDAKTGAVKWRSKEFTEGAQYASPIAIEHGGKRQYVQLVMKAFAGVDAADGKLLWRSEFPGRTAVVPTPIHRDGHVYVAAGYNVGCKMVKLGAAGAEEVYANNTMVNHHGGVVLVGDHLYGYSDKGGWTCQEFKTGAEVWKSRALGKGAVTCADGMLYCMAEEDGTVVLAEASPGGWKEHGRFKLEAQSSKRSQRGRIWTHPVVSGGRLYLRDQEFLSCYEIKG